MGEPTITVLLGTAVGIGFVHTLFGIDHSLPFIVLARAQQWSLRRLWAVTALCGLGHVASSVLLGAVGIGLGVAVQRLEWVETFRGGLAAWLLIGFGLAYAVWSLWRTMRGRAHTHAHVHPDGTMHTHEHTHAEEHAHGHAPAGARTATVAALFVVFALGPCEALIPLLMAPAFEQHWSVVVAVAAVFALVTVGTMLGLVTLGWWGLQWRGFRTLERHMHAVAGLAIAASGLAIELVGHAHP